MKHLLHRGHFSLLKISQYSIILYTVYMAWLLNDGLVLMQMVNISIIARNCTNTYNYTCIMVDLKIQQIQSCEHIQVPGSSDK